MSLEREKLSRPVRPRRDDDEIGSSACESEELDPVDGSTDESADDTDESGEDVSNCAVARLLNAYSCSLTLLLSKKTLRLLSTT
jgi:hypothetical protein